MKFSLRFYQHAQHHRFGEVANGTAFITSEHGTTIHKPRHRRPVISPPALLRDVLPPRMRHRIQGEAPPTFDVRPLSDVARHKKRNDLILRSIYIKCGADLMQGKRIRVERLRKECCPFATEGQLLAAIDTSLALRWVNRLEGADFWIDGVQEPKSTGSAADAVSRSNNNNNSSSSNNNSSRPSLSNRPIVSLRLSRTQVYRNFLLPSTDGFSSSSTFASFLTRPAVEPTVFVTSTAVVMRRRRSILQQLSKTHDLMLLGPPSQVFLRLSLKDPSSILSSYMNGSLYAEGLNDALGFPLPVAKALDAKVEETKSQLRSVEERLARETVAAEEEDQKRGGGVGMKAALAREHQKQRQLFYVRQTLAQSLNYSSPGGGGGHNNETEDHLDVVDPLEVDVGPLIGSFGSDTAAPINVSKHHRGSKNSSRNRQDGEGEGVRGEEEEGEEDDNSSSSDLSSSSSSSSISLPRVIESERALLQQLADMGEIPALKKFDSRRKFNSELVRRAYEAFESSHTGGLENASEILESVGGASAARSRVLRHKGLLGRTFNATRSVLSIAQMLSSRRRVPFEMAVLEFQTKATCFCLIHFLISRLRTQVVTHKKISVMAGYDHGQSIIAAAADTSNNSSGGTSSSSGNSSTRSITCNSPTRHLFFSDIVLGSMARMRVPFPASTLAMQMFMMLPHSVADLTALIRDHVKRQCEQEISSSGAVRFASPSLTVSLCLKQAVEDEILPILQRVYDSDYDDNDHQIETTTTRANSVVCNRVNRAARELHLLTRHRWKDGGPVAMLVLSLNAALGFGDFSIVASTARTERECVRLVQQTREGVHQTQNQQQQEQENLKIDDDDEEEDESTALMMLAATGPEIVRRNNTDSVMLLSSQEKEQQQKFLQRAPLCAMVGDCRILENIYDCVRRAARNGMPAPSTYLTTTISEQQQQQKNNNVLSSSCWLTHCPTSGSEKRAIVRLVDAASSNQQEKYPRFNSQHLVSGIPAHKVHFISSLQHLCLVSGWTAEFGVDCATELLRRFLVGHARDAVGIASFYRGASVLREGYNMSRRRHAALFAFPISRKKEKKREQQRQKNNNGADDDADDDDEVISEWNVVVPKNSSAMSLFRRVLEDAAAASSSDDEEEPSENTCDRDLDDDDEDDDNVDDIPDSSHSSSSSNSASNGQRQFIAIQVAPELYIFVCREDA